jgi:hypothetical protein
MSTKYPGGFIVKNPTAPTTAAAKGIWTLNQVAEYTKQNIWPRTPGAPTIGTATAGNTSASVAFTPSTDLGAGAITYTATSSPGGFTGTGSSPITVSGLTNGTSYTFTVRASTPGGTSPASGASNSVAPFEPAPTVIGQAYGGGYYTGQISTTGNSVATDYLVVAPVSSGQASRQWKTNNSSTAGTSSDINGPANSSAMNDASHPAAQFCKGLAIGGFSDWYMPAKNELEISYYNLKPTDISNFEASGSNPNAVPSRGNYAQFNPSRTSAVIFQDGGAQAFGTGYYWSSTQSPLNSYYGRTQIFYNGQQTQNNKTNNFSVRAIRRVPV